MFFFFFIVNSSSAQSMLDMNDSLTVKSARIKKCIEVEDGKDLWTMYYDLNGRQLRNTFFATLIDTNGNFLNGFYGVTNFAYDPNGNVIEVSSIDPISGVSPCTITKYRYDENRNLIKKELNQITHKLNKEIDTEKVITLYYYSDSKLTKEKFESSHHFVETSYAYEDSNRLNLITKIENKGNPEITYIKYAGDTIFYRKLDKNGFEFFSMYQIKNKKNKIKEVFTWDKVKNTKLRITYFFDSLGLLNKKEVYNFNTQKISVTVFRYELY